MEVSKIYYERVFPLAQFINEKIGMEVIVGVNQSIEEAFKEAKDAVWKLHIDNNPQLYPPAAVVNKQNEVEVQVANPLVNKIYIKVPPEVPNTNKQPSLIDDINTCTDLKTLESYKLMVKMSKKPELQKAYDEMAEKLSKPTN